MGRFRGLDTEEGWIQRRFAALERKVAEFNAARRLENATIGEGGVTVQGTGGVTVEDGGGFTVRDGGSLTVDDGGNLDVVGGGAVQVWGTGRKGTMTDGVFGVTSLDGSGNPIYPSTLAQVDGFLCDAGPGKGYAVFRVDAATGKAVVTSSVGQVQLPYQNTSDAANTRILFDGSIRMVTSSRRYKQDIADAEVDPTEVLSVTGRTWRDRARVEEDPTDQRWNVGFIAEELDQHPSLRQFVDYDDEGRPDAIQYDRLTVALLAVLKDQDKRLSALEQQVQTKAPTTLRGKA